MSYLFRMRRVSRILAALGTVLLLVPFTAGAQTETGRVTGTVSDQSGATMPGVNVTLTQTASGTVRTAVTDQSGRFTVTNLQPGPYQVKFERAGFNARTADVLVTVGSATTVDTSLQVGGAAEAVTVIAESAVINTANSEVATTLNELQIRELPTLTRNVYALVGIAPNVIVDADSGRGTGYAINGARSASTNILLDGAANNDEFRATVGQAVPLDSVQEFSVITNNFSAQYGRATGGIVNVATKSGTNNFRGTGYEFFRSDKLATNTFDNKANGIEKGEFTRHQTGFSIGGPIVRDKMHFFSNIEYIRVRSFDTQISWVPTPQLIAASAPATQAFFAAYGGGATINGPILTRGDVSGIFGAGSGAFSQLPASLPAFGRVEKSLPIDAGGGDPQDDYQWVNRVDYSLSPATQLYVRYAYQNQEAQPGTNASSPYAGFDTGYLQHNHNLLGSVTHVFAPTFTTQTKVTWNRLYVDEPLNGDPQPTLYMNPSLPVSLQGQLIAFPGYLPWSPGSSIPFGGPQQLLQLYQDQTWIRGKHDLRFGGQFVRILDDRTFGAYANSVQSLNSAAGNNLLSLDNFVLGQLRRFNAAINPKGFPGGTFTTPVGAPSFNSKNSYNEFALYFNDNWAMGERLTLNLGVRYEYFGPQTKSEPKYDSNFYYGDANASVNSSSPAEIVRAIAGGSVFPSNTSPIGGLYNADRNNWAPRFGFAWNVTGDGKTSVRGGYGIGYERNFGNVTYNVLFNPPDYLVSQIDAPTDVPTLPIYVDNQGPFGGVAGVIKPIPIATVRHIDQNIETAYSHFYGLSLQREIATNLIAKVEYNGSLGRKLYDLANVNKRGAGLIYLGQGTTTGRPNPLYGAFNTRGNRGESEHNGFTFGLESRRLGNTGISFNANYTYGTTYDNLSSTFSESGNNFNIGYLDAFDPMLDWGYAGFDVRHRGGVSGIWQLPFFREGYGLKRALFGDWQLNTIFTARSGFPFTVFDCTNAFFEVCMRAEDPAGINKNAKDGPATGDPNQFELLDLTPIMGSAGKYSHPVAGTSEFGPYPETMTRRNAFRGPGLWNVDMGLSKRVRFNDKYAVQFRIEAYNLFNHANMFVQSGDADVSSSDKIYGNKDGNRRLQLGFKFEF